MPHYRHAGEIPRKRHARFPAPGGGLYTEELMGEEGFSSASSLLYHLHPPTAIVGAENVTSADDGLVANSPLLPRHIRTHRLDATGAWLLLANDDVRLGVLATDQPGDFTRDATRDHLLFVQAGTGVLESVFGSLAFGPGDYVVVPRSTTHRIAPDTGEVLRLYVIEASGHVHPPRRYRSDEGQFLEHAPYSERDLRAPEFVAPVDSSETDVVVRHRGGVTRYTYAHHPFDVVGWDGCLYPYALSIHDFEPIVKRFHAPPPVHQTFEGPGFVVCSFCPRPYDFDPTAVAVPYHHANVDSDEVLFYVDGSFMSRKGAGIEAGSMTLHPAGFVHGPQPGSVEAAFGKAGTDEIAVMVDTFRPLLLAPTALEVEDRAYPWTWVRNR